MENRKIQFRSKACNLHLSAYPGHFATKHSHVNYFLDMTTLKVRQSNAEEAARALVPLYKHNTVVDTIVCLDGTEVIGAFLAEKLTESGFFSYNQHKSIYIVTPEIDSDGQMFFRKNIQPMIKDRNIIILMASVTTGITINRSWNVSTTMVAKCREFQQYLVRFLNMVIFLLMRCLLQMIFLPIIHIANTTAHIAKMDKKSMRL